MSDQEYYMPWGKYRGENIDNVPRHYLEWLLEQEWIGDKKNESFVEAIEAQLAMRDRSHISF